MQYHKISDIFPLMTGNDFESLKRDINEHGLLEPIVIHDNQIVDGRNRYRACMELGIEPQVIEWKGNGMLIDFVISRNLHRRHLNESQRAMVAARIADMRQGERTDLGQICTKSAAQAGKLLNVSERSVKSAKKVQAHGGERGDYSRMEKT